MAERLITAVPFFPGVDPRIVPTWALQQLDQRMRETDARMARRAELRGVEPPKHDPAFVSIAGHRVWEFDRNWWLVELEPGVGLCVSVLFDGETVRCYCPDGVRLVGCAHVLVVGDRDVALPGRATREHEVAVLEKLGWTDRLIADYLGVSAVTVRTTRLRIRRRLEGRRSGKPSNSGRAA